MTTAQEAPGRAIDGPNVQTDQDAGNVKKKTFSVCLCSAFRDAVPYLDRYLEQTTELYRTLDARGHNLHCVWGEGDSTDETAERLAWAAAYARWPITVVDCTHGGPAFGSIESAQRFRQLAHVGRCIWAAIPADSDAVVYVESDLIWDAATLLALLDRLIDYPAICPMVFLRRAGWHENSFYDTFAAVGLNGRHFTHHPPYHAEYVPDRPFPVASMGSCMALRGAIARRIIFDDSTIFPDICRQIAAGGDGVYIDPGLCIYHP